MKRLDLVGEKFGKLLVIADAGNDEIRKSQWLCECDCGNEVIIRGSCLKNGNNRSCGCLHNHFGKNNPFYNKYHSKETKRKMSEIRIRLGLSKGKNNPNWKSGITPERIKDWQSSEYKQWRKAVYERDSYICQMCGDKKGGNLQAHHILPWANFKEFRYNINNGITLCKKCHEKILGKELKYVLKFLDNLRKHNKLIKENF